jgi:hypothetical protein
MCEWLKQAVLKTALPERVTGVRIPLPPPSNYPLCSDFQELFLNVPKMCPQVRPYVAALDDSQSKLPVPKTRAGSTGRCNTGLQFTRRSFKAQGFSRALIEAQSYLVEIGLRVDGQVGLLGEVLS